MAFATTLCNNLGTGSSAAVVGLAGTYQICVAGQFTPSSQSGSNPTEATFRIEISPLDGAANSWVPVAGAESRHPTTFTIDIGTGAHVRCSVYGGGPGVAINAYAAAMP